MREGLTAAALDRLLHAAVRQSNRPILLIDAQAQVVWVNQAFTTLLGYVSADVSGRRASDVMASPRMPAADLAAYRARPWGTATFSVDALAVAKDGRDLWLRVFAAPLTPDGEDAALLGYSVVMVTDLSLDETLRGLEREMLAALASDLPFGALGDLLCRRIEDIAPGVRASICRIVGGRLVPWAAPSFSPAYHAALDGVPIGEGVASCGTAAFRGEPVMVDDIVTDPKWALFQHVVVPAGLHSCWSYPVKGAGGKVLATFAFYFSHTGDQDQVSSLSRICEASVHLCALAIEREITHERLYSASHTDPLTGLPHRERWSEQVIEARALRGAGPAAVVCFDVDRLGDINQALGFQAGDRVIVAVANSLACRLEPGELLGRVEQDRFAVLLPGRDRDGALERARELQILDGVAVRIADRTVPVTVTAGVSVFPTHGRGIGRLLETALAATRQARRRGVSGALFDAELADGAHDRLLIGGALAQAIERGNLMQWYQPQVRPDGAVHGVEALSRWHDPLLGDVSPLRFIPLAEELGKSPEFDRWATGRACAQFAEWRRRGVIVPSVSVNVAPATLTAPGYAEYVEVLLKKYALPPAALTVEVTERTTNVLPPDGLETLSALRDLGVGVSVDDFGTGFSSLGNLITLPVTEIKIDHGFVAGSVPDARSRALVQGIVELGARLQLSVVAEGVETDEQRRLLTGLGCPVQQGFLYAAAMPANELAAWVRGRQ